MWVTNKRAKEKLLLAGTECRTRKQALLEWVHCVVMSQLQRHCSDCCVHGSDMLRLLQICAGGMNYTCIVCPWLVSRDLGSASPQPQ